MINPTNSAGEAVSREDLVKGLRQVGLHFGDTVLVHSSLGKLGGIAGVERDHREEFFRVVYEAFAEALAIPEGTLVVPTFTHEYARHAVPFVYEESPSEVGAFTEYVRKLPEAYRSDHPLNSFAAIGRRKHEVCKDTSRACYGHDSVFDRLLALDAKMMFFGAGMYHMTLKHHLEQEAGLPYVYHKAYFTPAYKDGNPMQLPYTACVRYLNGQVNNNDCTAFRYHLEDKGMLSKVMIGGAEVLLMSIRDAFNEGFKLLQEDPCYFLTKPYYATE